VEAGVIRHQILEHEVHEEITKRYEVIGELVPPEKPPPKFPLTLLILILIPHSSFLNPPSSILHPPSSILNPPFIQSKVF
jgi:hypothetical protein